MEQRKLKKMSREKLDAKIFQSGLNTLGKTANGVGYAYLGITLSNKGIFTILVGTFPPQLTSLGHQPIPAHPEG